MPGPKKVLVLPFRRTDSGSVEYAVLKKGKDYWQGIAGGVEEGETLLQAAKREAEEEGGVPAEAHFMPLDSVASFERDKKTVTQYAFAVELNARPLRLSEEHSEYRWLPFDAAIRMMRWQSDRDALTELNSRLEGAANGKEGT
jgi:dATP pyrophosphohydrolase